MKIARSLWNWLERLFGRGQEPVLGTHDERRHIIEGRYHYRVTRKQRFVPQPGDEPAKLAVLWDISRTDTYTANRRSCVLIELRDDKGGTIQYPTNKQLVANADVYLDMLVRQERLEASMAENSLS